MTDYLRTLRLSAWLGWQLETNWANPWLFALYMLVKPVCGLLNVLTGVLLFSQIRGAVGDVNWLWLFVFAAIGSVMLWASGMIIAAACLNMSRNGMFLSESIAGIVYLLSGVVFPLGVLPVW